MIIWPLFPHPDNAIKINPQSLIFDLETTFEAQVKFLILMSH
jgi:hypothetical protein